MKTPRRRMTARNLMVAVAASALIFKLGLAYVRSPAYWREARKLGQMADVSHAIANGLEDGSNISLFDEPADRKEVAIQLRQCADDLDRKRVKYLWAALLPWLPKPPDLPAT